MSKSNTETVIDVEPEHEDAHTMELVAREDDRAPAQVSTQASGQLSPLVQAVMSGQMQPSQVKEMLEIQKDYEANEARKAYHAAVAAFKANAPTIKKDRHVSFNQTEYNHTSLGYALTEINPVLSKHGLSISWRTRQEDGFIYVTAILSHSMGYSEETELFGKPDDSGKKNAIQQVASTVTYLKRHTAFAILGLESIEDDDGAASGNQADRITEDQAANIKAMIEEIASIKHIETANYEGRFLGYMMANSIKDIPAASYDRAVSELEKKRKDALK